MALDFMVKDVIHKITAKFVHAFLPDAKKPYNLVEEASDKVRVTMPVKEGIALLITRLSGEE